MSIKKKIIYNGIATALQKLVRVADQLILVPFFISSWGAAYYGEWLTLTTIPSVLSFTDLGFGSAAANTFVLRYASEDKQGAADIARSGFFLLVAVVITSLVISGGVLAGLVNWGTFDKIHIPLEQAIKAVSFLMAARIIDFFHQFFEAYYRAARKAAFSVNLSTIYASIRLASSITILSLDLGIVELAFSNLVLSLIFNIFYALKAYTLIALHKQFTGKVLKKDIKLITNKGMAYLVSPIWQAFFFQGTTIAVRITLGAESVALFNSVRTISRSANQLLSLVNGSVFPELQYEIGAGHMERGRRMFRVAIGISILVSAFCVFILAIAGPTLYSQWTRNMLNPPLQIWYCFLTGIILNSLWWTAAVVFRAVNKPAGLTVMGFIGSVISVSLSYILAKYLGLVGAAIGSIALEIIMATYVLPVSCKMIQQPFNSLLIDTYNDFTNISHHFREKFLTSSKKVRI